jgi:dihydropteroate synthase
VRSPHRPELWGVVNVTPDSFSDGGLFVSPDTATAHALQMVEQGASVIDVGGESTRPGASRVSPEEEIARVIPVVTALASAGVVVSIDTMRASTAAAAVDAGARIINDVSGGLADPGMFAVVAACDAEYVLMHWRGHSDQMDSLATYDNVVAEVSAELHARVRAATEAGIDASRIMVDPGLGFAKTPAHNWSLLSHLSELAPEGMRMIVGASRKRFLGELVVGNHEPAERDGASAALGVLLAEAGVFALRVHNVRAHREALDVWQAFHEEGAS